MTCNSEFGKEAMIQLGWIVPEPEAHEYPEEPVTVDCIRCGTQWVWEEGGLAECPTCYRSPQ